MKGIQSYFISSPLQKYKSIYPAIKIIVQYFCIVNTFVLFYGNMFLESEVKLMNILKELRKKKDLTLKELSEKVNISADSLGKYEREERNPKIDKWEKLANFYNVPVTYLQGIESKKYKYSKDDIFKILQSGYIEGTNKQFTYTKGNTIVFNGNISLVSAINRLFFVKSVSSYLENSKNNKNIQPEVISISKEEQKDIKFWKNNFGFLLESALIQKSITESSNFDKEDIKEIISKVISNKSIEILTKYSNEVFFKGISAFINNKKVKDKNKSFNFWDMLDTLSVMDEIEKNNKE